MSAKQPIPGVRLDASAATQVWGFIGHRGSGKTYAALRLAEFLMDAGAQWVSIDPVGNHNGLRLSSTGKKASDYTLPVLGGLAGDLPLESSAGAAVADFLVESGSSAVLDVSLMSGNEQARFVADLCERLFRGQQSVRRAMHVAFEEAHLFAPQKAARGKERMVGAVCKMIRLGRNYGIGASLISQRPQSIDKEVLNQADPLCVGRLPGSHERRAIAEWMKYQGGADDAVAELHRMPSGDLWFWSPGWLEHFMRVRFTKRATFDSSATPAGGSAGKVALKPIDLDALGKAMTDAVETAKANDPKELKKRITELEKQLASQKALGDEAAMATAVSKALIDRDREWQQRVAPLEKANDLLAGRLEQIAKLAHANGEATVKGEGPHNPTHNRHPQKTTASQPKAAARVASRSQDYATGDTKLGKGETAILTAVAQHDGGVTREQLTVLTGYKRSSRDTFLQRLRAAGLIEVGDTIWATDAGRAALGDSFEPLPTGDALREYWFGKLQGGEANIFSVLVNAWPKSVDRETISETTGYKRSSRDTFLQRLSQRKLITTKPAPRASDTLFE